MTAKPIVDFIIVGAMKSGTTSLGFHLRRHPEVCIPRGEVHFFDNERHFEKGLAWYERQLGQHRTDRTVVTGEKTAAYAYDPKVAPRIREAFPDVKLVWVFREPVSRAYSNYIHAFRNGALRLGFEEAVAREPELMAKDIYFGYLERSRYAKQVERFLEYFPREQMHFMVFERLIAEPAVELDKLFRFIGVTGDGFEVIAEPRGRTALPRFQPSVWAARQLGGTGPLWQAVRFLNLALKKPGYPRLSRDLQARLKSELSADNARLAELTGLDLSLWK
jgi:hypothetical protein